MSSLSPSNPTLLYVFPLTCARRSSADDVEQKSNDPADLQPSEGLRSTGSDAMAAHHARDPHVPSQEIRDNLPEPAVRIICLIFSQKRC